MRYWKKTWQSIRQSFVIPRFHYILLADLLYYALALLAVIFIGTNHAAVRLRGLLSLMSLQQGLEETGILLSSYGKWFLFWFFLLLLALAVLYTYFKGIILIIMGRMKFGEARRLHVLLPLTLGRYIVFAALFYIGFYTFPSDFFPVFLLAMLLPFSFHMILSTYPAFFRKSVGWRGYAPAFKSMLTLYRFIVPYTVLLLVLALCFAVFFVLGFVLSRVPGAMQVAGFLFFVSYLNWARHYLYLVVRQ